MTFAINNKAGRSSACDRQEVATSQDSNYFNYICGAGSAAQISSLERKEEKKGDEVSPRRRRKRRRGRRYHYWRGGRMKGNEV